MKSSNAALVALAAVLVIGGGVALATLGNKGRGGGGAGTGGGSGTGGGGAQPDELTDNWGTTPATLRPLFLMAEKASGVPGSARVFAVLARLESKFNTTFHNESQVAKQASQAQYLELKNKRPPLAPGAASQGSNFGRGGLFGLLGPEFLWSGYKEMGAQAPLLSAGPTQMFDPRYSLFAVIERLQQEVLPYLTPSDGPAEAAVGLHNPDLLGSRNTPLYKALRQGFIDASRDLGINLTKIPKLTSVSYPGAAQALNLILSIKPPPGDIKV